MTSEQYFKETHVPLQNSGDASFGVVCNSISIIGGQSVFHDFSQKRRKNTKNEKSLSYAVKEILYHGQGTNYRRVAGWADYCLRRYG